MSAFGYCDEFCHELVEAFEQKASSGKGHIALACYYDGNLVVDLQSSADADLFLTWSTAKPVLGYLLQAVLRGARLDDSLRVKEVWPQLGAGRLDDLDLRNLIGHAAGLISLGAGVPVELLTDCLAVEQRLQDLEPAWSSGTRVGEHAFTFGFIIRGLVERLTKEPIARVAERLALWDPSEFLFSVSDTHEKRLVPVCGYSTAWWASKRSGTKLRKTALQPDLTDDILNSSWWIRSEVPGITCYASAREVARFYDVIRSSKDGLTLASASATNGYDVILRRPVVWSRLGGQVGQHRFGMDGIGGQFAGARMDLPVAWCLFQSDATSNLDESRYLLRLVAACARRRFEMCR